MITASKLAGFFTAHALWCVSDGETLIPMLAYTTENGERKMERLVINDDLQESVTFGNEKLDSNEMDANDAVLLYDGRILIGEERVDSIIVQLRACFSPDSKAIIAVPYTPRQSGDFRIHKLKLLAWENCDDFNVDDVVSSFYEGVGEHEEGAKIWNACLDESK